MTNEVPVRTVTRGRWRLYRAAAENLSKYLFHTSVGSVIEKTNSQRKRERELSREEKEERAHLAEARRINLRYFRPLPPLSLAPRANICGMTLSSVEFVIWDGFCRQN